MRSLLRVIRTALLWWVALTVIGPGGLIRAQGMLPPASPPGVVPLFQPTYNGLERFFVDSTLFDISFLRFRREVRLDQSQEHVIIEERLYDRPYRLPVRVSLDFYVRERIKFDNREMWRQSLLKGVHLARQGGAGGIELNIPLRIKSKAFKRIFGGDRVGLVVSGNISFELAGRTESREGSAVSAIEQRGNFAPKFKQTQQFRVEGRVGDKVTVSVDQNSEATFDFENTLKLTYEGDEDDMVQRIEAGNVALSLPSTNYVSTSANHQGLFGLKTQAKVGNFQFTGIASLERGENEKITISGTARENTFRLKDYEYVRDRFFFVDDFYRDRWEESLDTTNMIWNIIEGQEIEQLDVWKTVTTNDGEGLRNAFFGFAVTRPDTFVPGDNVPLIDGSIEQGIFRRLEEGKDYQVDPIRGIFWLNTQPQSHEIIAVAYKSRLAKVGMLWQEIDSLAQINDSLRIVLRLIKGKNPVPSHEVWDLTMRNVYSLGAAGIPREGFDVKVLYTVTGEDQDTDPQSGKPYNFLLGLDRVNDQGIVVPNGDRKIDVSDPFRFDLANGYLFFPSRTPFDPQGKFNFDPARHVLIYDIKDPTEERRQSKFEIEVTTKATSTKYELGFNVLEGSERVVLNGQELKRDRDYTIDYFSGTLEITHPAARRADAQVEIEFEKGALFQLDKKTLLGGRWQYNFNERNFIGLTTLFYSKSTLDQRVRLGQEPHRNFVWDVNAALEFKPNFISTFLDKLPIVETSAESNLKIEAEYAQVNPNPNTFNEEKIGDTDGVAFIDDFEGSKRFTSLGINYRIWTQASVPAHFHLLNDPTVDYDETAFADQEAFTKRMDRFRRRLTFNWFNPFEQVPTRSIWPDKDVNAQTGTTTNVLVLRWNNRDVPVDSAWAGIMRSTAGFPDQKKTKFIEIWVRGDRGQVNIDVGQISEDWWVQGEFENPLRGNIVTPSYRNLNTEDRNLNGLLEDEEDVGIDGVPGADGANVPGDAGNDDWAEFDATSPQFLRINGTEGNGRIRGARFPDTEDLDGDGTLNLSNNYFEYSFDLSDPNDKYFVGQTFFDDGTPTGWKLYRIPLRNYTLKVGNPDTTFQQVLNVRLWVNNLPPTPADSFYAIQIAAFDFVGNEWEEIGFSAINSPQAELDEEKFNVTVYNTDEHSGAPIFYTSPPGVEGIRDRITRVVSKEQSLVLQIHELPAGTKVEAKKQFRDKVSFIHYKRLKMFVRGDPRLTPQDSLIFFIRFGPTDKIYYEYREPVYPGPDWDERNTIDIDFDLLAKTKDEKYLIRDPEQARQLFPYGFPDSLGGQPVFVRRDPNYPEKLMVVVGNPSLHNINYIVVGAMNAGRQIGQRGYPALDSLEIWLDELRVTGAERESGSAMRLSTQLAMADVANIRAQWELIDDDFRRAEEQFAGAAGRNKTRQVQSYFASVKLDKFLPQFLGLEIPLDGSIKRSTEIPKYFFNSDQRTNYQLGSFSDRLQAFFGFSGIPEGLEQDATFSESKSIGGTLRRRGGKRDPWYLRLTFNQMVFDVDYSIRHAFNPNTEFNNSTNFRGRFNYSIPFGKKNFFHPFGWLGKSKLLRPITGIKFYYLPSSASMTLSLNENTTHQKSRFEKSVPDPTINVRTNRRFAVKYRMFDNLTFDWSRDYQSDARLDSRGNKVDRRASDVLQSIFERLDFGTDMQVNQRFSADYSPKLFSWLNTGYNYGANYVFTLSPSNLDRTSTLNVNQNVRLDLKLSTLVNSIYKPRPKRAVRPPSPRRPRGGQKPSEEEEGKKGDKKEGDKKKSGTPRFSPPNPLMMLWHFFNAFKSISFNFRFEDSYRHSSLAGEPVWQYQFGFFRGPKVGQDTTLGKIARRPDIKNTRGIDGTLQLDIIRNVKSSFKYTMQRVSQRTHQNHTRTESSTIFFTGDDPDGKRKPWWKLVPDWRISISGVEKFPLFKLIAKSATLEHARGGKFNKSARVEDGEEFRNSATYSINYQPLLGLNISTVWGPTATVRATRTVSFDYRSAGGINKREQSGLSISISYSVSKGFKLPLPFFKKPLKNEISFSLTYDRTSTASFSKRSTEAEFEELEVNKSWKVRPSITYRFSQKVNGTAFYEQGSSTTKRTGTTNTKEFGINVNIAIR